jgi:colanic acid biosynthesis protein WcaH
VLDSKIFKTIVDSVPLISIDFFLKNDNKFLLGKRINRPAQGYFFSIGGRIFKNETINDAMIRIAKNELNIKLKSIPVFIGVFEHFYKDGIYENTSTHYVNLAYEVEVYERPDLPDEQHIDYKWFSVDELLKSKQVHKYTKDCFKD